MTNGGSKGHDKGNKSTTQQEETPVKNQKESSK